MAQRKANKAPVSVLAFDLDHFKSINDRFGHSAGDATLHLFAAVARQTMRSEDVIGRLGGEEFVALLPNALNEAIVAAERVRQAFAAASNIPGGDHVPATVSIGAACGSASAKIEALIGRADGALYRAKSNGRNRVETAEEAVGNLPEGRVGDDRAQEQGIAIPCPISALAVPLVELPAKHNKAACLP
jgi:diguanylate cyclase (GGDEF)-like protein